MPPAPRLKSPPKPCSVQTIALLSTISEREGDQNVVTLTLHASKGLKPHVVLSAVNEGLLPKLKTMTAAMATALNCVCRKSGG